MNHYLGNKFYHINCGVIQGFPALRKAVTTHVKNIVFLHVCWYRQSAAYKSLAFGTTRSGWWMKGKAFTILKTSCLSEFSRIMAAKTLSKLPKGFISRWTHAHVWTNCFITFSTPWKIFFRGRFVCWRHKRAQTEYEARSRNWIWLNKFTSYVINCFEQAMNCAWVVQTKFEANNCT